MAVDARLIAAARAAGDPVAGLRAVRDGAGGAKDAGATLRAAFPSLTPQDVGRAFGPRRPDDVRLGLLGAFGPIADRDMVATALASSGLKDPAALALAVDDAVRQPPMAGEVVSAVSGNIPSAGVAGLVSAVRASQPAAETREIIESVARAVPQVTTASVSATVRSMIPMAEGGATRLPGDVNGVVLAIGDEALSHVGLIEPRPPGADAVALGKALFSSELRRNGVPQALAGKAEAMASGWADGMARRGRDALSGIVGSTVKDIAGRGMSEALARPVAGLMHDAAASGVKSITTTMFGMVGGAAATAIPVVGPLAAGLVSWGLGKLLGSDKKDRPDPPPVSEQTYPRKFGVDGSRPVPEADITPSLVLAHLLRACMRWHRAQHSSPVVQFTDWRASPSLLDPQSDLWMGAEGERFKNWGRKAGSDYIRLGPWTPSAYGPAFRLVWSGSASQSVVDGPMRGGLRSTPGTGPAAAWMDSSVFPQPMYRFSHDFLAEFTGVWDQGLSNSIARGIAAAFSWGEDRPHLQRFRPYLQEIGWAEFICSSALVGWHADHDMTRAMAFSKVPSDVLQGWVAEGPWERGRAGWRQYIDELYSDWGSDPTGSGLAALCFVTAEIRRQLAGAMAVKKAAELADAGAAQIKSEDKKARDDAFAALTGKPPTVAMVQERMVIEQSNEQKKAEVAKIIQQLDAESEAQRGGISMAKAAGIGLAVAAGGLLVGRAMRSGR